MKAACAFVAFATLIALANWAFRQVVPVMPSLFVQALGWGLPCFAVGFLWCRRKALRLVASTHGEAAAAALNERL